MPDLNDTKGPVPSFTARDYARPAMRSTAEGATEAQSLALMPADLEVVPPAERRRSSGQSGKEAKPPANVPYQPVEHQATLQYDPPPYPQDPPLAKKRLSGRKCGLICALIILLLLAIALGVGLGIGLGLNHSGSSSTTADISSSSGNSTNSAAGTRIGGALDASYYSKSGAWNGTAIAIAQQAISEVAPKDPVLYFQHYSGEVRWTQLTSNGSWLGGSSLETVASDAKNATPISAVTSTANGTSTTHVFYVDQGNTIKEFIKNNDSDEWRDGPLGGAALHPDKVDLTTMAVCLTNSDAPAITLWYASNSSTYQEYLWRLGDDAWTYQHQWRGYSGTAGIACFIETAGTASYAAFVNTDNDVEIWYKMTSNGNEKGSAEWSRTNINITSISPTSSLAYTDLLYVQTADSDHIHAYNITWQNIKEGTMPGHDDAYSVEGKHRVTDSRFAATMAAGPDGEKRIVFLDQVRGNDITQYERSLEGGETAWNSSSIEIPHS